MGRVCLEVFLFTFSSLTGSGSLLSVDCRVNCWVCFWYRAQACRLSFPSSYVSSGTLARDFKLFQPSYLFVAYVIPSGGLLIVGKVLISSVFRLSLLISSLFRL